MKLFWKIDLRKYYFLRIYLSPVVYDNTTVMCHAHRILLVKLFFHYLSRICNHQNFIYTVYRKTHTATKKHNCEQEWTTETLLQCDRFKSSRKNYWEHFWVRSKLCSLKLHSLIILCSRFGWVGSRRKDVADLWLLQCWIFCLVYEVVVSLRVFIVNGNKPGFPALNVYVTWGVMIKLLTEYYYSFLLRISELS